MSVYLSVDFRIQNKSTDKFPGFYTEECYYILSDFLKENYKTNVIKQKAETLEPTNTEEGVEEVKEEPVGDEMESEIRSYESECEDGVQSEQFSTVPESVFEFEW